MGFTHDFGLLGARWLSWPSTSSICVVARGNLRIVQLRVIILQRCRVHVFFLLILGSICSIFD